MESLVDAMWEADPPESARKTIQVYVHRLRRTLGDDDRVSRTSAGYMLLVNDGELDSSEFYRLVRSAAQAARGDLAQASDLYGRAIALWRGRAFEDALQTSYVAGHARPLEELRLEALEGYAHTELTLGRPERLTATLAKAVLDLPYAERLRECLMLAYYRCGRQTEALAEYRSIHHRMVDELGIEPGAELRRLNDQILRNDPVLETGSARSSMTVHRRPPDPAQLPRRIGFLAGRRQELSQLHSLVSSILDDLPLIVTISGTAGVGKTTLAVHLAHDVAARFPHGQLYVNLRGFDEAAALRPADALRGFLSALGVTADEIPDALDQQAALFRSKVAGRSMIVLLDGMKGRGLRSW